MFIFKNLTYRNCKLSYTKCLRLYTQGPGEKWLNLRNKKFPKDYALQHFDSFYPNVYAEKWLSSRIAMHWPNKYVAVVNPFVKDPDEIGASFLINGATELSHFYSKYKKHYERQKLRKKMLEDKKAAKLDQIAKERGVDVSEIETDIEVSDISDAELDGNLSAISDPENILEMFQTDIESLKDKEGFMENLSSNIDLNDFIPSTEMRYEENVTDKDTYYRFYDTSREVNVERVEAPELEFPETPKIFSFPRQSLESFPSPDETDYQGMMEYFLIDAAAVLPVLALDIQVNDRVADLCAAPGGKTLLMLSTLRPSFLFACDPSNEFFPLLEQKVKEFFPKSDALASTYHLEHCAAEDIDLESVFDKVLVDVPSTNDRLAIQDNHDNLFKSSNLSDRIELPNKQKSILLRGLQLLKPGGSLVYTTNTLSPIQNDGVIHMSLHEMSETSDMVFNIMELKEALRPLRGLYRFHTFNYGIQVLPSIINNCGPIYICKIKRVK
ncbi:5-methylcytosine rRNA methyltransferase NSUN4 [Tetranychus urticae]|uniref:NOL1/NOP2/Sun domain family member 4 n=1 Tax=Tetranychus urticae TaxID=32264 RepID=T1KWG8_TETUR|nr:5-methylcytosine rRNA methyltransferase NSUN4 [Tetranychus urticae]